MSLNWYKNSVLIHKLNILKPENEYLQNFKASSIFDFWTHIVFSGFLADWKIERKAQHKTPYHGAQKHIVT